MSPEGRGSLEASSYDTGRKSGMIQKLKALRASFIVEQDAVSGTVRTRSLRERREEAREEVDSQK